MKLVIFHHNGQMAEYIFDAVSSIEVQAEHALEDVVKGAAEVNAKLAELLNITPSAPAALDAAVQAQAAAEVPAAPAPDPVPDVVVPAVTEPTPEAAPAEEPPAAEAS